MPAQAASFQVVVDFDDTIKITNVLDVSDAIYRTLYSQETFAGMDTLLLAYQFEGAKITILSSGLAKLRALAVDTLKANNIFFDALIMRPSLSEDIFTFKYKRLVALSNANKAPMILIGDDTQKDADVFAAFKAHFPDRVLATYVHRVTGKKLPPGSISFSSAYELSLAEFLAERLSAEEILATGDRLSRENNVTLVYPKFMTCPHSIAELSPYFFEKFSDVNVSRQRISIASLLLTYCARSRFTGIYN